MGKNSKNTNVNDIEANKEAVDKTFKVKENHTDVKPTGEAVEPPVSEDIHNANEDETAENTASHGHAHLGNTDHIHPNNVPHHRHKGVQEAPVGAIRQPKHEVGNNLSWRAILGGLATFIALSILLSLVGTAIGLGATDLTAQQPLEGVGTGLIIWTIISLIISLGAAGYVSGYLANRAGFMHGFLTWAIGLIAATYLASSAVTGAFNTLGTMLGATGQAAGDAVGNVSQTAGNLSQDAFDAVTDDLEVDTSDLDKDVEQALKDSEIETLQPDYLQNQIDDTVKDIQDAAKSVIVDGKPVDQSLQPVYDNIDQRIDTIGEDIDEDELSNALAENSDLDQKEADEAVKNIQESYGKAQVQAQDTLEKAKSEMKKLEAEAGQTMEEGKQTTNDAMNEASKYSIYAFIGALLALLLSSYAGKKGAEKGQELEANRVLSIDETVV